MKKNTLLLLLLLSAFLVNAQYAVFKLDSLKGKLNGEEIIFDKAALEMNIVDTSDFITLGHTDKNKRVGVKFFLVKVISEAGTYYLPSLCFLFEFDQLSAHDSSSANPNIQGWIMANKQTLEVNSNSSVAWSKGSMEMAFHLIVDGFKLDYSEIHILEQKPGTYNLSIKELTISGTSVIKKKNFELNQYAVPEKIALGTYRKQPVTLEYLVMTGKAGTREVTFIFTTLFYNLKNTPKSTNISLTRLDEDNCTSWRDNNPKKPGDVNVFCLTLNYLPPK